MSRWPALMVHSRSCKHTKFMWWRVSMASRVLRLTAQPYPWYYIAFLFLWWRSNKQVEWQRMNRHGSGTPPSTGRQHQSLQLVWGINISPGTLAIEPLSFSPSLSELRTTCRPREHLMQYPTLITWWRNYLLYNTQCLHWYYSLYSVVLLIVIMILPVQRDQWNADHPISWQ